MTFDRLRAIARRSRKTETGLAPLNEDAFDEESYLERYTDVAREVARGGLPSGRAHYERYGRAEGRSATTLGMPDVIDLPAKSRIAAFAYPAFEVTPPNLIDGHRMPDDLRTTLTTLWTRPQPAREPTLHVLDDVIVVGAGLVFDARGRLFKASAYQTSKRQIEAASAAMRAFLTDGSGRAIGGTTLLCEKIGNANYGHWLFEMAPVAFALKDRLAADWFLRAPFIEGDPKMCGVVRDTLDLLGIDPARVRWGLGTVPQRYERLALVRDFSHHGAYYSPFASAAFQAMASSVPGSGRRRIWVSRAGTPRRLADEGALTEALSARGWAIIEPGTMSMRQQIAQFKDAEVVAGVAGAGLTNIGFAPRGTRVVAFVPDRMPDIFFWSLAQMREQPYTEIRCPQQHSDDRAFNWDGLLMTSAAQALAQLNALLG